MSTLVRTASQCPACRMTLHLRTPLIVDEDGDPAIDRADVERAVTIHLRHACPDVPRLHSHVDETEDEDEGVP